MIESGQRNMKVHAISVLSSSMCNKNVSTNIFILVCRKFQFTIKKKIVNSFTHRLLDVVHEIQRSLKIRIQIVVCFRSESL